jgi:hypothetical protein
MPGNQEQEREFERLLEQAARSTQAAGSLAKQPPVRTGENAPA